MQEVSRARRMKKALGKFALFLGLAILSIFIQVAHFVLVPTFLLLSFVFAWIEFGKRYYVKADNVPCIHCKKTFSIEDSFSETSVRVSCGECGVQNSIKIDQL